MHILIFSRGQRSAFSISPHFLPCLRQALLLCTECFRFAGLQASGESSVSTSHSVGVLGLSFSVGSEGSDSGACVPGFNVLCLEMFCLYIRLPHMCNDPWGQKRASYPLGLKLQMLVSYVGGGKLDQCPLQDQPVLLATESALQAPIPSSFF